MKRKTLKIGIKGFFILILLKSLLKTKVNAKILISKVFPNKLDLIILIQKIFFTLVEKELNEKNKVEHWFLDYFRRFKH